MIVGPTDLVLKLKIKSMMQFECDGCRVLTEEYTGSKIEYAGRDAIWMVQTVLMHIYEDEFELGKRCYNMPANPGAVLMHPAEGDDGLSPKDQMMQRSGMG
jgi:hypothetical protein